MAWSDAARTAAAAARRGRGKLYDTGKTTSDNEGKKGYKVAETRRQLLQRIAAAKNTLRGKLSLRTMGKDKFGNKMSSGGPYGSKSAASRDLAATRNRLYGKK